MEDVKIIETETARLWMDEDGILRALYNEKATETLTEAKKNVAAAQSLAGDRMVPVLVNMSGLKRITREARIYYTVEAPKRYCIAQALITNSAVSRMIGNFVIGIQNPEFPLRLFSSEEEALPWLREYLK